MRNQVLVAYGSKYGATAVVAEKIGDVLREAGLATDVLPVKQVKDLTPYMAVVLGSAVYYGRWRKEAVKFLEENETLLAERNVWLFSTGPTGEGDPEALLDGWHFPEGQQPIAERIHPHNIVLFHGDLDIDKVNFLERSLIKKIKSPVGDFRDWEMITAWATAVADTLKLPV